MTRTTSDKRDAFRKMHEQGCFILPNPWDIGGARYLQGLGFGALATSSAGAAWAAGRPDNAISLQMALDHMRDIVQATDVPVNADFENGFAEDLDELGENVCRAVNTGIAALSIEDSTGRPDAPLFTVDDAVERLRRARLRIDEMGGDTMLIGRAENFFIGRPDLEDTVTRIRAYADAGADCLYAPGISTPDEIKAVVAAAGGKPVNLLIGSNSKLTLDDVASLGVRRISTGGGLARAAWGGFMHAAWALAQGRLDGFGEQANGRHLNDFFRISSENPLTAQPVNIMGDVQYREGEGPLLTVPRGVVEVRTSPVDAIISWSDGQSHGLAAMPVANFCQYVADGAIALAHKPPLPN
jgi:2-methylisocitrate lyase-like PEP mutase family enzyme